MRFPPKRGDNSVRPILLTIYLFKSLLGWIALTCDRSFSLFSLLTANGSLSKAQLSVSCCIFLTDMVSSLTRISEGSKKYHFLPLMIRTHAFTTRSCVIASCFSTESTSSPLGLLPGSRKGRNSSSKEKHFTIHS